MGGMSINVEGLDRLRGRLEGLPGQIESGGREAVEESLEAIANDYRSDVAVDEGELQDAIDVEIDGDGLSGTAGVHSAAGVRHAGHNEFGTSKMPARPALQPAAEQERGRLADRVAESVQKAIQ
jgi:HK97 gp10 family phage protein